MLAIVFRAGIIILWRCTTVITEYFTNTRVKTMFSIAILAFGHVAVLFPADRAIYSTNK
jgi:hypothetical protein